MYIYNETFYNMISELVPDEKSIMPYIQKKLSPKSIVDFGCGQGRWLAEAKRNSPSVKITGLDGHYIDRSKLLIDESEFVEVDLSNKINLNYKYDLAISTEVAEHIEEKYADVFIDNIVSASDNVLFSAAIPGQGGNHHVNERWQSYWIEKFSSRGYGVDFSIRKFFWDNDKVNSWRRQNILFFSKELPVEQLYEGVVDVVHPQMINHCISVIEDNISETINYMVSFPEICRRLQAVLDKYVGERLIIVYPYGRNGKLCELLLKYYYHQDKYLFIDNILGNEKEKLKNWEVISGLQEKYILLNVCSNPRIYDELVSIALHNVGQSNIINVFEGVING